MPWGGACSARYHCLSSLKKALSKPGEDVEIIFKDAWGWGSSLWDRFTHSNWGGAGASGGISWKELRSLIRALEKWGPVACEKLAFAQMGK